MPSATPFKCSCACHLTSQKGSTNSRRSGTSRAPARSRSSSKSTTPKPSEGTPWYVIRRGHVAGAGGYWGKVDSDSWGFINDKSRAEKFDCRCWPERIVRNLKKDRDLARVVKLVASLGATPVVRPRDEWHDDHGPALWWRFPIVEPPYAGTPLDDDFPDYATHWTRCETPVAAESWISDAEMQAAANRMNVVAPDPMPEEVIAPRGIPQAEEMPGEVVSHDISCAFAMVGGPCDCEPRPGGGARATMPGAAPSSAELTALRTFVETIRGWSTSDGPLAEHITDAFRRLDATRSEPFTGPAKEPSVLTKGSA